MSVSYCCRCMSHKAENDKCPVCGDTTEYEAPVHHLKPGTVLRDKYLIGKAIGEGGFGITYVGRDLTLDMKIAVKEYYPNGFSNRNNDHSNQVTMSKGNHGNEFEKEMQRFLSEARILARFCNDPGVVGVRDFFRDNGTAYIVMEYLDGITLKNYLNKYGPIPSATFAEMIDPILQALHEIHNQGLIHRDISPDNIMMLKNGRLKLLDFGAAREVAGDKSLSVMLKPGYAPEEQYRSKGQQGPWTDVYAMCATIYKCITGITPDESIQRVFEDELKKPSELGVEITAKFEQALLKGLSVKSTDRIQSIDILRRAINKDTSENLRNVQFQRIDTFNSEEPLPVKKTETIIRKDESKTEYHPVLPENGGEHRYAESPLNGTQTPPTSNTETAVQGDEGKTEYRPETKEQQPAAYNTAHAVAYAEWKEKKKDASRETEATANKKSGKILVVAISCVAVLLIACLALLFGGKTGEQSMEDVLPSERTMASDCSAFFKESDISGKVVGVDILDEELNEKFKTYIVTCNITVIKDGVEKRSMVIIQYDFEDGEWVCSEIKISRELLD